MKILVTGSAGFIGSAVALRLLQRGEEVIGIDNLSAYYDVELKHSRLKRLLAYPNYEDVTGDLADASLVGTLFAKHRPQRVINLAAQAGVRHGLENPYSYSASNLTGFVHILEGCRQHDVEHLVYASSSSVYGANTKLPFSVRDHAEHPLSLYAATKKANEMLAHSYAHLFELPCTGLRFFTVYGPWGRPDMAFFKFTRAILAGESLQVFNGGDHVRDFTYIDDIVEGVLACLDAPPAPDPAWCSNAPTPWTSSAPFRLYNIGNSRPVSLTSAIRLLEQYLGRPARLEMLPLQPGDLVETEADVSELARATGYAPKVSLEHGLRQFVEWYRDYYRT